MNSTSAASCRTLAPTCRFCRGALHPVLDLGATPLCESFLSAREMDGPETHYPLKLYVCKDCHLVQLKDYVAAANIFSDYAYFSSYSKAWLEHARRYTEMAAERFGLTQHSQVVELASNDGYLLQYFMERGIPVLGVEPAANVARVAMAKGVPTVVRFFGTEVARELVAAGAAADLVVANNVMAHVPDLNDFVGGIRVLLAPNGVATVEVPHLLKLIEQSQFDTIYHEHFSYFSLLSAMRVLARHGLRVFDVEELWSHGGSLRYYICRVENRTRPRSPRIDAILAAERAAGLDTMEGYDRFAETVAEVKRQLLEFLITARREGRSVVGYGAPGKGNTLLNFCGVRHDFIEYTVDRNPHKHGKFLPGSRIPIHAPERIDETKPDYILILPWNLREEIMEQLAHVRRWNARFVVPIPQLTVFS